MNWFSLYSGDPRIDWWINVAFILLAAAYIVAAIEYYIRHRRSPDCSTEKDQEETLVDGSESSIRLLVEADLDQLNLSEESIKEKLQVTAKKFPHRIRSTFRQLGFVRPTLPSLLPCMVKDVVVINTLQDLEAVLPRFRADLCHVPLLGLDCEWKTSPLSNGGNTRKPVALVQLSTCYGFCILIRFCNIFREGAEHPRLPKTLLRVFEDGNILKVGVEVCRDADYLFQDYKITIRGLVDLRFLAERYGFDQLLSATWKKSEERESTRPSQKNVSPVPMGLAGLAEVFLGYLLQKTKSLSSSNWERPKLLPNQIEYAAQDAVIAVSIFHSIMIKDESDIKWDGVYDRCVAFLNDSYSHHHRNDINNQLRTLVEGGVETVPCRKNAKKQWIPIVEGAENIEGIEIKPVVPKNQHQRHLDAMVAAFQPKSAENIRKGVLLLSCEGDRELGIVPPKKAQWYLKKGLAEELSVDQNGCRRLRLKFKERGRPETDDEAFYTKQRETYCVVCHATDRLIKKHIVPHEYRRHLIEEAKSHGSHDVVLICLSCEFVYQIFEHQRRMNLAVECRAPISGRAGQIASLEHRGAVVLAKTAAKALLRDWNTFKIPLERRLELEQTVCDFICQRPDKELTKNDLRMVSALDPLWKQTHRRILEQETESHGKNVVEFYALRKGTFRLVRDWREFFLRTMHPRNMPDGWSVTHKEEEILNQVLLRREMLPEEHLRDALSSLLGPKNCYSRFPHLYPKGTVPWDMGVDDTFW